MAIIGSIWIYWIRNFILFSIYYLKKLSLKANWSESKEYDPNAEYIIDGDFIVDKNGDIIVEEKLLSSGKRYMFFILGILNNLINLVGITELKERELMEYYWELLLLLIADFVWFGIFILIYKKRPTHIKKAYLLSLLMAMLSSFASDNIILCFAMLVFVLGINYIGIFKMGDEDFWEHLRRKYFLTRRVV